MLGKKDPWLRSIFDSSWLNDKKKKNVFRRTQLPKAALPKSAASIDKSTARPSFHRHSITIRFADDYLIFTRYIFATCSISAFYAEVTKKLSRVRRDRSIIIRKWVRPRARKTTASLTSPRTFIIRSLRMLSLFVRASMYERVLRPSLPRDNNN